VLVETTLKPFEDSMDIRTHPAINQELCGRPVSVTNGHCTIEMTASPAMIADDKGLVHGGFIFGLADYAAMLAVNHPHVVLGSADVKFLKPVRLNDVVVAQARIEEIQGKKHWVAVLVTKKEEIVFQGMFTCFVLEKHVLSHE
jgi:acyl-coenzyme A thioesterase PaaI-like protein